MKFAGDQSEPFKIKAPGVRQGVGLSIILFNFVLEKVSENAEQKLSQYSIPSSIKLIQKKTA